MASRVQPVDESTVGEQLRLTFEDAERRGAPNSTLLRFLARHPKVLRAALEMASLFSEDYHAISDEHFARWREFFSEEELIELEAFLAICDGFGKLVEVLGLGAQDQVCAYEL